MAAGAPTHQAVARGHSDHRVVDFAEYGHTEFQRRQELARIARRSFRGKVIALYTSLFCELALGHPVCLSPVPFHMSSHQC